VLASRIVPFGSIRKTASDKDLNSSKNAYSSGVDERGVFGMRGYPVKFPWASGLYKPAVIGWSMSNDEFNTHQNFMDVLFSIAFTSRI
jgi:hypothetical protein